MKPLTCMIIAGEPSGDALAAELVLALKGEIQKHTERHRSGQDLQPLWESLEPRFFGAGGPRLKEAGVEILHDLTQRSTIGPTDVVHSYFHLRSIFYALVEAALERQPDVILLVDYSYFNHRFAKTIRRRFKSSSDWFHNWTPQIVKYVSPQVWASRPKRARTMADDFDLLLCLFPFEVSWYQKRVPKLSTLYVGHPVLDRYPTPERSAAIESPPYKVALLPGSRVQELKRHLPILFQAALELQRMTSVTFELVTPSESLASIAKSLVPAELSVEIRIGGLEPTLRSCTLCLASTGSVTMECARFGVPTITLYRTSWLTYQLGKRLITVPFLSMPNILAEKELMPEFVQDAAQPTAIAQKAKNLLENAQERGRIHQALKTLMQTFGSGGASQRAAAAVLQRL